MSQNYNQLFTELSQNLKLFTKELNSKKSTLMATDQWTVKDVLCHLVFWHEAYASNYQALAAKQEPHLPEKMSTINKRGVSSLRKYSIKKLLDRLQKANQSLYTSIVKKKVLRMTYSKGGRTYESADFLAMIARHITTHTKQIKRAK